MLIDIKNLEFIDKRLRDMGTSFEEETGLTLTITSLYRMDDNGVHGTLKLRGIDYRMRSRIIGKAAEKYINDRWIYDPNRPEMKCAVLHDAGNGLHLHTQVSNYTIKIII